MALVAPDVSGSWGIDLCTKTTPAMLDAFARTPLPNGQPIRWIARYVFFSQALRADIDADELRAITARFGLVLIQHPRAPKANHLDAHTGKSDADWAVTNALAAGYDPALVKGAPPLLGLDMEGVLLGSDAQAHAETWVELVRGAGFRPLVYFGFDSGGIDTAKLGDCAWWCDFAPYSMRPKLPWSAKQHPQITHCGVAIDPDEAIDGGNGFAAVTSDGRHCPKLNRRPG